MNLEQLSMHPLEQFEIDKVIDAAFKNPLIQRMQFEVTRDLILQSIKKADDLGTSFVKQYGDEAYKRPFICLITILLYKRCAQIVCFFN